MTRHSAFSPQLHGLTQRLLMQDSERAQSLFDLQPTLSPVAESTHKVVTHFLAKKRELTWYAFNSRVSLISRRACTNRLMFVDGAE